VIGKATKSPDQDDDPPGGGKPVFCA